MSMAVAQPFEFFLEFANEVDSEVLGCVTPAGRSPSVVPKELEIRPNGAPDGPDFTLRHNRPGFILIKQDQDRVFGVNKGLAVPDLMPRLPIPVLEGLETSALEAREML